MEDKAIDTLRNCTSQLLLSIKEDEKIKPDLGGNSMSKRKKLESLMALLNEAGDSLQTKPQEKKVLKQKKRRK